jgi:hypothetical protein
MSDYLVNLARRTAGIAPVARPRSMPGPGPIAGAVLGGDQASPPSPLARSGTATGTGTSVEAGSPIRTTSGSDDDARAREVSPLGTVVDNAAWRDEHRPLRIVDRGAALDGISDPPTATVSPRQPVLSGADPSPSVGSLSAIDDHASEVPSNPGPARARPAVEPRRDELTVELPLPRVSARARGTDAPSVTPTVPILAPAPLGGPRTVIEGGPGREVHVRIGTIEIHAEADTPAPVSLPATTAPTPAIASPGGFDGFVRLRSYAPWER